MFTCVFAILAGVAGSLHTPLRATHAAARVRVVATQAEPATALGELEL